MHRSRTATLAKRTARAVSTPTAWDQTRPSASSYGTRLTETRGVTVFGRYMTVKRSQLTVTVGPRSKSVLPYPATIAKIVKLNQKEKVFRLEFFTPPGQGINQQLIVKRGAQASSPVIINYRPPHISKVRLKDCGFDIFGWDADPVEGDDIGADGKPIAPEWPFGKVAARPRAVPRR